MTVQPKTVYHITGNTYANRAALKAVGAEYVDESTHEDAGFAKGDRYWVLDLSRMSKSAVQRSIDSDCWKLAKAGCKFQAVR